MTKAEQSKGVLALIFCTLGFAGIAISSRFLSYYTTLFQQLYLSVGLGFLFSFFLFPQTLSFKKIKNIPLKDILIILFRVVIGYLLAGSLYRQAIVLTKISNVTFIQSIPFTAFFGWLLFKEKFSFKKLFLILTAWFGVSLIALKSFSGILSIGTGEVFSFVSAFLFSLSYVSRKWQTDYLNDKEITQILLFIAFIVFLLISLINQESLPSLSLNFVFLSALLFTGLFNTINIYFLNFGFKHVQAVLASNILTLEAVFSLLPAFLFFKEFPSPKELLGGIIILLSVYVINRISKKD
jgi:drug/metabolite transporter (DMT)-like permease